MAGEIFAWQMWSAGFGMSPWLIAMIVIWSLAWKGMALWKAAKKDSKAWFVVLFLLNTVGVLEILYLFVFSKDRASAASKKKKK